jgi:TM2 domain-containing membrane protein YozV
MAAPAYQVSKTWTGKHVVKYPCPHCSERLCSPLDDAGKSDTCPRCQKAFDVPGTAHLDQVRAAKKAAKERAERRAAERRNEQRARAQRAEAEQKNRDKRAEDLARIQAAFDAAKANTRSSGSVSGDQAGDTVPKQANRIENSAYSAQPCRYCGNPVAFNARTCPKCGGMSPFPQSDSRPVGIGWNPVVAFLLSFFIPGVGQIYKGQVISGVVWFVLVAIGYVSCIVPGLVLHVCCCIGAVTSDPYR